MQNTSLGTPKTIDMRRRVVLVAVALLAPGTLSARSFQSTEQGFVLRRGKEYICFDKGLWSAGIEGGKTLHWHMFLWHDKWTYETLPKGKTAAGPTLHGDGHLSMKGSFSAQGGSAPMRYAYHIQPVAEGVCVRCELEKSGPLNLDRGVWLHVLADTRTFHGTERVWISPSWHGPLAGHGAGNSDCFLLELDRPRSLCLSGPGYRQVESERSSQGYVYRVNLLSGDFEPGKTAVVEYLVGFADLRPKDGG